MEDMNYFSTGFEDIDWVNHCFFSRLGGVSSGEFAFLNCGFREEDSVDNVIKNHAIVAEHMGVEIDNFLTLEQVHGIKVMTVENELWGVCKRPKADAIVTKQPNVAIGVCTADCAPILFADRKEKVIGVAHAGWKSAIGGIIEETIKSMEALGASAKNIEAVIGPCISFNSYEVQDVFKEQFMDEDPANDQFFKDSPREGRFLFNLPGYCLDKLEEIGLNKIVDLEQDTLVNDKFFFSNRRSFLHSKTSYGVQPSVIMIKG